MNNSKKETAIALKKAQTSIGNILKMIDDDKYCMDILQQILAVSGLLKSASNKILENHLNTCFSEGMTSKKEDVKSQLVREVMDIVSLGKGL